MQLVTKRKLGLLSLRGIRNQHANRCHCLAGMSKAELRTQTSAKIIPEVSVRVSGERGRN